MHRGRFAEVGLITSCIAAAERKILDVVSKKKIPSKLELRATCLLHWISTFHATNLQLWSAFSISSFKWQKENIQKLSSSTSLQQLLHVRGCSIRKYLMKWTYRVYWFLILLAQAGNNKLNIQLEKRNVRHLLGLLIVGVKSLAWFHS